MIFHNDKSIISTEENDTLELNSESATETSINLGNNETPVKASTENPFSRNRSISENQESTLDSSSEREAVVNDRSVEEYQEGYYRGNVSNMYQSCSNNEQQFNHVAVENGERNHQIENIQRNIESNESMNNDNKVKASLTEELLKLSNYGWYWGPISGNEADAKLISEPDGAFLVRDSSDDRYIFPQRKKH